MQASRRRKKASLRDVISEAAKKYKRAFTGNKGTSVDDMICDLDNTSMLAALALTIFAGFSAAVSRDETAQAPEGKYFTKDYIKDFWRANFFGIGVSVFVILWTFFLRLSLLLSNQPDKHLFAAWFRSFALDVIIMRLLLVVDILLVGNVSANLYCIKNQYDGLNTFGWNFTRFCMWFWICNGLRLLYLHLKLNQSVPPIPCATTPEQTAETLTAVPTVESILGALGGDFKVNYHGKFAAAKIKVSHLPDLTKEDLVTHMGAPLGDAITMIDHFKSVRYTDICRSSPAVMGGHDNVITTENETELGLYSALLFAASAGSSL